MVWGREGGGDVASRVLDRVASYRLEAGDPQELCTSGEKEKRITESEREKTEIIQSTLLESPCLFPTVYSYVLGPLRCEASFTSFGFRSEVYFGSEVSPYFLLGHSSPKTKMNYLKKKKSAHLKTFLACDSRMYLYAHNLNSSDKQ